MLAAARNTFPLAEMKGIVPWAQNVSRAMCYLGLEGQQSLTIRFIPTEISGGGSCTSKNSKSFYMQQYNEQEKDVLELELEVNWAQ